MSWVCKGCQATIDDDEFEVCWNCSCPKGQSKPEQQSRGRALECLRCEVPLKFVGTKNFHEGTSWGALGELGELFVNKESLEMYACRRCGKVELFLSNLQGD
ncbi:hypothetical protein FCL40_03795 [Ferrimonas sediminicola]|uniref:Uncharacterized protein n=1 Tax=Ferrimonas sediminicola TaxID=2569538 RepID=A0A4U1BGF5_9GAMM|nr:hypothetical protein [Ferrimonas sediminicola]TKB50295.1 hypothetical protein FCL40_03795 [Ferrimonas sediminicola]